MDAQSTVSFIPKRSVVPGVSSPINKGGNGIVLIIAVILFISSAGVAAAAFGYQMILKNTIASKAEQINNSREVFSLASIEPLSRDDLRINEARKLLAAHTAPSTVFDMLSAQTLPKVQYTEFKYEMDEKGEKEITAAGTSDSFETLALQNDQLNGYQELRDVVFSDLKIDEDDLVTFTLEAKVAPEPVLYSKTLENTEGPAPITNTVLPTDSDPLPTPPSTSIDSGGVIQF